MYPGGEESQVTTRKSTTAPQQQTELPENPEPKEPGPGASEPLPPAPTKLPPANVLTKMRGVMSELDRIQKDAVNPKFNYGYASEKAIKEALHPLLAKHGIILQLSTAGPSRVVELPSHPELDDRPRGFLEVPFVYRFWDADSGEFIEGHFIGSGQVRDDKGIYGAVTGAIKYILTSCFLIPTGDDPEREEEPAGPRAAAQPATQPASSPAVKRVEVLECWVCHNKVKRGSRKEFPAKYANPEYGIVVGDATFKCPECDKYVPVDMKKAAGQAVGAPSGDDVPPGM